VKDLYGYRQAAISVTTGPAPLDATIAPITRARKSLEYGLVTPQNRSVPTDSLIDKPPGIPGFSASVALSVVSAHKNSGTSSGMQLRSNVTGIRFSCALLAANSLSAWQSPGGMDGN
jgi:hypothetical protein